MDYITTIRSNLPSLKGAAYFVGVTMPTTVIAGLAANRLRESATKTFYTPYERDIAQMALTATTVPAILLTISSYVAKALPTVAAWGAKVGEYKGHATSLGIALAVPSLLHVAKELYNFKLYETEAMMPHDNESKVVDATELFTEAWGKAMPDAEDGDRDIIKAFSCASQGLHALVYANLHKITALICLASPIIEMVGRLRANKI